MKIFSQDLLLSQISTGYTLVRFAVRGYYKVEGQSTEYTDGVTVTVTADGYSSYTEGGYVCINVPVGTLVTYSITKTDYDPIQDETVVVTGDSSVNRQIEKTPKWGFLITPTPDTAHVSMRRVDDYQQGTEGTGTTSYRFYKGSSVYYTVSQQNMNAVSGTQDVPSSSEAHDPEELSIILTATLQILALYPSDASITWTVGQTSSERSITREVTSSGSLVVSKAGYDSFTLKFPQSGSYLTNTTVANGVVDGVPGIVLQKAQLTCSLTCSPSDAIITMSVNGGPDQQAPGELSVNCVMGDVITWSVAKTGWGSTGPTSGTVTMGTSSRRLDHVTLSPSVYTFTVTSTPVEASIVIMRGASVLSTGTGTCTANVNGGDNIRYIVSYNGAETDQTVNSVTENKSIPVTLNAANSNSYIYTTDTSNVTLPKGSYIAFLISGASSGIVGVGATWSHSANTISRQNARGGKGGNGGASGRVQRIEFSSQGTDSFDFFIGAGGIRQTVYGTQTPSSGSTNILYTESQQWVYNVPSTVFNISSDLFGGDTYMNKNNVEIGRASGAALVVYEAQVNPPATGLTSSEVGSTGGNAGGVGGAGEYVQPNTIPAVYTVGTDGQGGAMQGGDAVRTRGDYTYVYKGQANAERSYDTNGGTFATQSVSPGLGGKGLAAYQSQFQKSSQVSGLTIWNLLSLMSGGGAGSGGGARWTGDAVADWPHVCAGGPGGGGGAWENGEDGFTSGAHPVQSTPWRSGKGGSGAIIVVCTSWT